MKSRAKRGASRDVGAQHVADDLAEQLDVAERLSALAVGEVVVVETEGLWKTEVVPAARVDGEHCRAVVIHEVATDLVGGIGETAGGGTQEDRRRVDGAGAQDDQLRSEHLGLATLAIVDRRDRLAVTSSARAVRPWRPSRARCCHPQALGERRALGIHLPGRCLERHPTRCCRRPARLNVDAERQRRRVQAKAL